MKKTLVKKLSEDDILEILIEHFQNGKYSLSEAYAKFFGSSGKDLRAVIVLNRGGHKNFDLDEIENRTEYNGDHAFLINHPEFDVSKTGDGSVS